MCSAIDPCSGCTACTVTTVSGGASFLQPGTRTGGSAITPSKIQRVREERALGISFMLIFLLVIGSHRPLQRFQIGPRCLVAHSSVLASVLRQHKGALRIHHFQHRGLAAVVAQLGQPQALGGRGRACFQ